MSTGLGIFRLGPTTIGASTTTTVGTIALSSVWSTANKTGLGWAFLDTAYSAVLDGAYFEYGRIVVYLGFDGGSGWTIHVQTKSTVTGAALSAISFDVNGTNLRLRATEANGQVGIGVLAITSTMGFT
jgi:hypothetical protein